MRYKNDYAVPRSSPPAAFELLAFPPIIENNAGRRSESGSRQNAAATAQQRVNDHQANQSGAATVFIEKPWEQQNVTALHLDAAIPPADYQFALPERDQALIEQGAKSLEIRYVFFCNRATEPVVLIIFVWLQIERRSLLYHSRK